MLESYDLSEHELAVEQQLTAVLTLPAPPAGMDERILAAARARAAAITAANAASATAAAPGPVVEAPAVEPASVEHTVVEVPAGRLLRMVRFVRPLAAAACVLLAGTLAVSLTQPGAHHLAAVSEASLSLSALGAARVVDAEGALGDGARAKLAESWVAEGEPLHVRPGGFLELELACGTRLVLDGGSSGHLRFDRTARRLHLDRGRVYADVVKVGLEDDRPLVVHAPGGVTRVLGTQLVVKAAAARSRVTVREGVVELINQHGSSRVPAGHSGLLSNDAAPLTRELASVERHFRWMGRIQRGPRHPCEKPFGGVAGDDEPAIGTLTARLADGNTTYLRLEQQTVTTEVADGLARTTVELRFKNDAPERLEGQFRFALPRGADLARYAVEQGGSLREGVVVEREQARRIYREQKQEQRKTGLLEWHQGSAFTAKVFPIEPRGTKRIVIGFTSELRERDGVSRFVIPLVSEAALAHAPERLVLRVRLSGPEASAPLRCPSHRVLRRFHDGAQELLLVAEGLEPRNDFVLELAQSEPEAVEARVETTPGEPDALLVRVRPPFGGGERAWADGPLVVLCDASASQRGTLKEVQLELLEGLLERVANPRDVSVYVGHVDAVELQPSDAGPRAGGLLSALWRAQTGGALDLSRCLNTIGRRLARDAGATLIVLSDGNASVGRRAPHQIVNALRRLPTEQVRRVVTVGLGTALNANVLRGMASARGGVFVTVRPGDDLARKLDEVVSAVGEPVLTDLSVWLDVPGVIAQAPRRLQNLRQGETLTLGARRTGSAASGFVEVRGLLSGRPYRFRAPLQITPVGQGETLARRWARRRIDELTLVGPRTADEVLDLGLRYGIVTPRTSLLVLEPDQLQRYRLERRAKVVAQAQALLTQAIQVRHVAQARHLLLRALVKDPSNAKARKLLGSPRALTHHQDPALQVARLESGKGQLQGRIRKLHKTPPSTQNWRTRTNQIDQPVIVLEEEVETTADLPKGTDLSRLSNEHLGDDRLEDRPTSAKQRRLKEAAKELKVSVDEVKELVGKLEQQQQQQQQRPRRRELRKQQERLGMPPKGRKELAKFEDERLGLPPKVRMKLGTFEQERDSKHHSERSRETPDSVGRLARRLERIRPREKREAETLLKRLERRGDDEQKRLSRAKRETVRVQDHVVDEKRPEFETLFQDRRAKALSHYDRAVRPARGTTSRGWSKRVDVRFVDSGDLIGESSGSKAPGYPAPTLGLAPKDLDRTNAADRYGVGGGAPGAYGQRFGERDQEKDRRWGGMPGGSLDANGYLRTTFKGNLGNSYPADDRAFRTHGGGGGGGAGGAAVEGTKFPGVRSWPQFSIGRRSGPDSDPEFVAGFARGALDAESQNGSSGAKQPDSYDLWSNGPGQGKGLAPHKDVNGDGRIDEDKAARETVMGRSGQGERKADGWKDGELYRFASGQQRSPRGNPAARAYLWAALSDAAAEFTDAERAREVAEGGPERSLAQPGVAATTGDRYFSTSHEGVTSYSDLSNEAPRLATAFQIVVEPEPKPGSGEALLRAGRRVDAVRAFSAVVEDKPDDAQAHHDYAKALQRCGLYRAALVEFAEAARLDPRPARLLTLAWEVRLRGNPRAAERILIGLLRGELDAASSKRAKELLRGIYQAELKRGSQRAASLRAWIAALR